MTRDEYKRLHKMISGRADAYLKTLGEDNEHQQTVLELRLRLKQLEAALENAIRTLEYDANPPSKRIEWAIQGYALCPGKQAMRLYWNMWKARRLRKLWSWLNTHYPSKCGNNCAYVYPYGWTVEAGCPVHD